MGAKAKLAVALATGLFAAGGHALTIDFRPHPSKLETYRDWTIACDNRARCEAVSLFPEGGEWPEKPVMVGVVRDAGADADAEIWAAGSDGLGRGMASFHVDGRKIASAAVKDDEARILGPQASALAIAMARGSVLEVRVNDRMIGRPSISGAAAALRYMDARQGRAGTVTALIATGPLGRSAVKPAPKAPVIKRAAVPQDIRPAALWREELAAAGRMTQCAEEWSEDGPQPQLFALSRNQTLVLLPCGSGAYNFNSAPLIATGVAGRRSFAWAPFDFPPGWNPDEGDPMLVNAGFTPENSRLDSFTKGRGIGDCGGSESYVWDGARFRLVEATSMGECRGAWHWLTTWAANVAE